MKALFAGSFDPFSIEHKYIAESEAEVFETLYVLVANNRKKNRMFSDENRLKIASASCADIENVVVLCDNRLAFEVAHEVGAKRLVRGLRYTTEYEGEMRLATGNLLIGGIKTIGEFSRTLSVSSTDIRELIAHNHAGWEAYVDPKAVPIIKDLILRGEINL
jgi:pantetheine-phosphate adenylyltransferase